MSRLKYLAAISLTLALTTAVAYRDAMAEDADVLSPARNGNLQCYTPDIAHKTCRAIAAYRFETDGSIANDAEVLMQATPPIIMRTTTGVVVRGGRICGRVVARDVAAATFTIDGSAASDTDTRGLRQAISANIANRNLGEVCSEYIADGDTFNVNVYVDGVRHPEMDDHAVWIRPGDNYTINTNPNP